MSVQQTSPTPDWGCCYGGEFTASVQVMVTAPDTIPALTFPAVTAPFLFCFTQNLLEIVAHQAHQKQLQALKGGTYQPLCQSEEARSSQQEKLQARLHTIHSIVQQVRGEQPQYTGALQWLSQCLTSTLGSGKD